MRDVARLCATALLILEILIFIRVLLTWIPTVDHWNPVVRALRAIVDPVLAPFRHMLPVMSGIDLSPLLAIVVIDVTRNALGRYSDGFIPSAPVLAANIVERLIDAMLVLFIILALLRILISV